jgi:hypothetical protein
LRTSHHAAVVEQGAFLHRVPDEKRHDPPVQAHEIGVRYLPDGDHQHVLRSSCQRSAGVLVSPSNFHQGACVCVCLFVCLLACLLVCLFVCLFACLCCFVLFCSVLFCCVVFVLIDCFRVFACVVLFVYPSVCCCAPETFKKTDEMYDELRGTIAVFFNLAEQVLQTTGLTSGKIGHSGVIFCIVPGRAPGDKTQFKVMQ